jgi:hypothetical protein
MMVKTVITQADLRGSTWNALIGPTTIKAGPNTHPRPPTKVASGGYDTDKTPSVRIIPSMGCPRLLNIAPIPNNTPSANEIAASV